MIRTLKRESIRVPDGFATTSEAYRDYLHANNLAQKIQEITRGYEDKEEYFVDHLARGLGKIAASQYPHPAIVRMSDFKTNEYADRFDGFSIGSNDLTQLVLGVDRDTSEIVHLFDERNPAVKLQIRQLIQTAHQAGKKVGICGQAPSDYPEFAAFLIQEGIDSISLNPDSVIGVKKRIAREETGRSSAR
jgi:phosphoenolpyruvate synthase/pyruvate phosphate dikinase